MAYDYLVPSDIERIESMLARAMSLYANAHRDPEKPAIHPRVFMPNYLTERQAPKPMDPQEQYAALEQLTRNSGYKVFPPGATDEEMEAYILQYVDVSQFGAYDDDDDGVFPADGDEDM